MDRKDIMRWLAVGAGAAAGAAVGYELFTGRWRVGLIRSTYAIRNLPDELDGMRLVHLSDFHIGPWTPAWFIREIVERAADLGPHLIVMTGDYVDDITPIRFTSVDQSPETDFCSSYGPILNLRALIAFLKIHMSPQTGQYSSE